MLPELVGSYFEHTHHRKLFEIAEEFPTSANRGPQIYNAATVKFPLACEPKFTSLPLTLDTDQGKRVCQQIFMDLLSVWRGGKVDYLALYIRDW